MTVSFSNLLHECKLHRISGSLFQVQLFEYLRPLKKETEELRRRAKHQNGDLHKLRVDFGRIKDVSLAPKALHFGSVRVRVMTYHTVQWQMPEGGRFELMRNCEMKWELLLKGCAWNRNSPLCTSSVVC